MRLIIDIPECDYDLLKKSHITCDTTVMFKATASDRAHTLAILNLIEYLKQGKPYNERPHGKWLYKCCCGDEFPQCSVCGEINDVITKFCPDCGADMRGEDHD